MSDEYKGFNNIYNTQDFIKKAGLTLYSKVSKLEE